MKMRVVLPLILWLVKLCIGFAVAAQGSEGSVISPSPAFLPAVHPEGEAPGPIYHGQSWGSSASSPAEPHGFVISPSPATLPMDPSPIEAPGLLQPNGSFLHPPVTSPPPTSAPTPQKIKGIEPSISPRSSPSTKTLSPPYKAAPTPSTFEKNVPPSIQPSPPQRKAAPTVRPPVSTTIAPASVAIPSGNLPKTSPVSQPIEHGSLPPKVVKRNESKSHNLKPVSPAPVATPSTNVPKISPLSHSTTNGSLPPNAHREGTNKGHPLEPISPAPDFDLPKFSPVTQPTEPGSLPPTVHKRNSNAGHTLEPVSQAPVAIPRANFPKTSPVSQPTHHGSFPLHVHNRTTNKGHTHSPEPVLPPLMTSPTNPFPVDPPLVHPVIPAASPSKLPAPVISPSSTPSRSFNGKNGGEPASAPLYKTPKPLPAIVHSSARAPVISPSLTPTRSFNGKNSGEPVSAPLYKVPKPLPVIVHSPAREPVIPPPLTPTRSFDGKNSREPVSAPSYNYKAPKPLPVIVHSPAQAPAISPSSTPSKIFNGGGEPVSAPLCKTPKPLPAIVHSPSRAPVISPSLTPTRSFNGKNSGEPVSAPLYKAPKPLPAVHSPSLAPAERKAKPFRHAPGPLISSPKSPFTKEDHSPASSSRSTTFYKHHYTRNTITSPAPASSYFVSPPTSKHQDQPIPPSLLPTSGRRHHAPPPMNKGSADSPFAFPIQSPVSQVSPAPSLSFKTTPHSTKIPFHPPKVSPSRPSSKRLKKPILPQVQALPPPPPNEDCLSTICSEPYTNSPPGVPCKCVWPMKVGLRLSVPLYTFFPLVSDLASEIATGVFMKQSQVCIMGANAASEQPEKTDALIDLVPLGDEFDHTTAFLTSERFWHKQVVIKASYFGDYEVLYVSYPGLPPSPPLPPSSINMIDGGPYSSNGNNGMTIKPLGVDIQKRQHKNGLGKGVIAIIALSVFLAVVLCSAAVLALLKFRGHEGQPTSTPRVFPPSLIKEPGTAGPSVGGALASASSSFRSSIAAYAGSAKTFSMNEIEIATDNFDPSRILGEGGFGLVYSGNLEDGTKVAVKVLKREDHHGDREFLSEVEMLSRLHHRNLVKLIGICAEVSFRCLVYELIPNGSVESHLHGVDWETSPLDWSARIKIALGAARGLAYLHEDSSPHVIHRDFKSSNILLEDDFTPKVSDFGLARTAADEDNRHISTRVMGTFGYVAPEYAMTGHLLVKSDVYSYGVVLLELLTGRKPVDMSQPPGQENLVAWARPLLTSREGLEAIIDPSLGTDVPFDSVAKVAAIASMCVQPEVSDRPFMGEVVQALKLVCNECDEAKEAGSRSSSRDNLSVDLNTTSEQLPDNFQRHFSAANYDSGVDIENGLSASELFSSSARFGGQVSGSFRRHSYSGPLTTGRSRRLWQIIRNLSGGSVSEHGTMLKL